MPENIADSTNTNPANPGGPEDIAPVVPVLTSPLLSCLRRTAQITGALALGILLGTSAVVFGVAGAGAAVLILDALHHVLTVPYCVLPGRR